MWRYKHYLVPSLIGIGFIIVAVVFILFTHSKYKPQIKYNINTNKITEEE